MLSPHRLRQLTSSTQIDNCYIEAGQNAPKDPRTDFPSRFGKISSALQNVGIKGISICQWGTPYSSPTGLQGPSQWTPPLSNSYRLSDDIAQGWDNVLRIYNQAIHINLLGRNGPGRFADMDMLEVGNPGMTGTEQATHFAIWAMFKSPLMVSTPAPTMSDATRAILLNKDLLAINQDTLGEPVKLVQRFTNDRDVFIGNLANGDKAVLIVDQSNTARTLSIDFSSLGIRLANVKDAWTGQTQDDSRTYSAQVGAHGSIALRLSNIRTQTVTQPKLTWIEAESGTLAGNANKQSCAGCSGSSKVGNVGRDGTLTLSGIQTSQCKSCNSLNIDRAANNLRQLPRTFVLTTSIVTSTTPLLRLGQMREAPALVSMVALLSLFFSRSQDTTGTKT